MRPARRRAGERGRGHPAEAFWRPGHATSGHEVGADHEDFLACLAPSLTVAERGFPDLSRQDGIGLDQRIKKARPSPSRISPRGSQLPDRPVLTYTGSNSSAHLP